MTTQRTIPGGTKMPRMHRDGLGVDVVPGPPPREPRALDEHSVGDDRGRVVLWCRPGVGYETDRNGDPILYVVAGSQRRHGWTFPEAKDASTRARENLYIAILTLTEWEAFVHEGKTSRLHWVATDTLWLI